jgi:hypothetical protein
MLIDSDLVNQPQLSDKDASELAKTLYHEARHSEQFYRMAQMLATQPPDGKQRTVQEIVNELGITNAVSIVQKAVQDVKQNPLSKAQVDAARAWYNSLNSSPAVYQQLQVTEKNLQAAQQAYNAALAQNKQNPGSVSQQELAQLKQKVNTADQAYQKALNDYRNLPMEADAFKVENNVEKYLKPLLQSSNTTEQQVNSLPIAQQADSAQVFTTARGMSNDNSYVDAFVGTFRKCLSQAPGQISGSNIESALVSAYTETTKMYPSVPPEQLDKLSEVVVANLQLDSQLQRI